MYGIRDQRNFVTRKLLALGLTVGALVFVLVLLALVAAAPAVLDAIDVVPGVRLVLELARWVVVAGAIIVRRSASCSASRPTDRPARRW